MPKASLYFKRSIARCGPSGPGSWIWRSAISKVRSEISSGSSIGGRVFNTWWIAAMIVHVFSVDDAGYTGSHSRSRSSSSTSTNCAIAFNVPPQRLDTADSPRGASRIKNSGCCNCAELWKNFSLPEKSTRMPGYNTRSCHTPLKNTAV